MLFFIYLFWCVYVCCEYTCLCGCVLGVCSCMNARGWCWASFSTTIQLDRLVNELHWSACICTLTHMLGFQTYGAPTFIWELRMQTKLLMLIWQGLYWLSYLMGHIILFYYCLFTYHTSGNWSSVRTRKFCLLVNLFNVLNFFSVYSVLFTNG